MSAYNTRYPVSWQDPIKDYDDAKKIYDQITPVKAKNRAEYRPLFARYKSDHEIVKGKGYYAAVRKGVEVVKWYRDGRTVLDVKGKNDIGWGSFISRVSVFSGWRAHNKLWVHKKGDGGVYLLDKTPQVWKNGKITNAVTPNRLNYKRSGTKKVRELAAPFMEAAEAILRMKSEWGQDELGLWRGRLSYFAGAFKPGEGYDMALRAVVASFGGWGERKGNVYGRVLTVEDFKAKRDLIYRRLYPAAYSAGVITRDELIFEKPAKLGHSVRQHIRL